MTRQSSRTYEFGAFRLDVAEHRLLRHGQLVPLTPRVFALLCVLLEHAGHLVRKEQLLQEVWAGTFVEEANLNRAISVLRKALGETAAEPYIETVPKQGYRFVTPVRVLEHEPAPDVVPPGPASSTRSRAVLLATAAGVVLLILAMAYVSRDRSGSRLGTTASSAPAHRPLTFTGRELTPALSPDGRRIAYVSKERSRRTVFVRDLDGGDPVVVFSAPEAGWLRWSPDSAELLFWARGEGTDGLYVGSPSGRAARRIAAGGTFVACWSPDGSTIALAALVSGEVQFLDKAGDVLRRISLPGTREWIWDLDWSAAADRLLFVVDDEQRRPTVWTIRPDGSDQQKVLTAPMEVLAARWAPDGEAFYYFGRVNQTVSLFKARVAGAQRAAGAAPTPLLTGLETDEGFGLSADGTRLVYARAPYYSNLWLVEADAAGGDPIRQTPLTRGTAVVERPRVSPDGTTVLFAMGYESRTNLYTMPVTGGAAKQLTFFDAFSLGGVWSPDGRQVAFASDEGGRARAWLVDADGSNLHPLASGAMSESYEMAWAPGRQLLYQQAGNQNYYLVEPRQPSERLLIKDGSIGWVASPVYAPDGRRVAVSWNRRSDRGMWVIDTQDARETLVIAARSGSDFLPFPIGWSPDGRWIYAWNGKRAAYRGVSVPFELTLTDAIIVRVPVSGGEPETIVSLPFEEVGTVTAFPDGRRFLCTVYSSRSDIWVVEHFDRSVSPRVARRERQRR
jgi:Tol biopolymer transport system component/DNA-binding winged helix-turn-helix (wHTH) protein